jgi:hypothetical protein
MILQIEAARASWSNGRLSIAFDVVPEDHSHLDLKTGEIFQNPRYAALRKQEDKRISARLFVTWRERNAAGADLPSAMHYSGAIGELGAEISLVWRLTDDQLTNLHSVILAGRTPSTAMVSFVHGELENGWEPDGSGQKWDNEKSPLIPFSDMRFNFSLQASPKDQPSATEIPEDYDPEFFSDSGRVNFMLMRKLASVESLLQRLYWTVGAIALLVLILLLSRSWR